MEQNKYELGVIVRADLGDEVFRAELDRVKALLERFGATIEKVDEWGRRRLAYPIQKLTEGMYTFITYTSPASTPKEVESRIRLMENVLRFMNVNLDHQEDQIAKAKARNKAKAPRAAAPVVAAPAEEPVVEAVVEAPVVEVVATPAEEPVATPAEETPATETAE